MDIYWLEVRVFSVLRCFHSVSTATLQHALCANQVTLSFLEHALIALQYCRIQDVWNVLQQHALFARQVMFSIRRHYCAMLLQWFHQLQQLAIQMKHLFLVRVKHAQLFTIPSALNAMQLNVFFALLGMFTIQLLLNVKSNPPQPQAVETDSGTILLNLVMMETLTTQTDAILNVKSSPITNVCWQTNCPQDHPFANSQKNSQSHSISSPKIRPQTSLTSFSSLNPRHSTNGLCSNLRIFSVRSKSLTI